MGSTGSSEPVSVSDQGEDLSIDHNETSEFEHRKCEKWETSDYKIQDLRLDVEQLNNKQPMDQMMEKMGQELEELRLRKVEFHRDRVLWNGLRNILVEEGHKIWWIVDSTSLSGHCTLHTDY